MYISCHYILIFSIFFKCTPWVALGEIIQQVYHFDSKDECILNSPTGTMQLLYLVQIGFSQSNLKKNKNKRRIKSFWNSFTWSLPLTSCHSTKLLCVLHFSGYDRAIFWEPIHNKEFSFVRAGPRLTPWAFPHPKSLLFCAKRIAPFIIPTDAWPGGRESQ